MSLSWVVNEAWLAHRQQELETDLMGAHLLATDKPPAAQFLG